MCLDDDDEENTGAGPRRRGPSAALSARRPRSPPRCPPLGPPAPFFRLLHARVSRDTSRGETQWRDVQACADRDAVLACAACRGAVLACVLGVDSGAELSVDARGSPSRLPRRRDESLSNHSTFGFLRERESGVRLRVRGSRVVRIDACAGKPQETCLLSALEGWIVHVSF